MVSRPYTETEIKGFEQELVDYSGPFPEDSVAAAACRIRRAYDERLAPDFRDMRKVFGDPNKRVSLPMTREELVAEFDLKE